MRIDRLTIRNFKGFVERTLEFRPPRIKGRGSFYLLVGENGSGKSSALDALAVALGVWQVARPTAGWRGIRKEEARLVARVIGDTTRFDPEPSPAITAEGIIGEKPVVWTRMNPGHSTRTSNAQAQEAVKIVKGLLDQSRTDPQVTLPVLSHYGAGRAWLMARERFPGFTINMKSGSRFDAYFYCLEGRTRDGDVNQWFLFETLEAASRGKKREGFRAVEAAVLNCLPGATGMRFDSDRKQIVIALEGGEMPFYSLSDGQRTMLSMVADLAIKAVMLNPHLGRHAAKESPGIVLVDELDLHLHPKWQRKVVDDLRKTFSRIQFICTTHSPFLIQALRPGELLRLDSLDAPVDYTEQSIEDIVESVQGVPMPQRSRRAEEMSKATAKYLTLVRQGKSISKSALRRAEREYRSATEPFTPHPGLNALLKLEAMAAETKG